MDRKNGRFDVMEEKQQSGSFRQKSKVPRARFPQRSDYFECSSYEHRNGGLKNVNSSRDYYPQATSSSRLQEDTDENKEWNRLLGERVCISGVKQGILRYYGRTNFAQGYWCGVELDEPVGKNNGTVSGVVYFTCKPNHGIFAPVSKVSKLNDLSACDWRVDLKRDSSCPRQLEEQNHPNWDYNLRVLRDSVTPERKFIKNSNSDPTFMRPRASTSLPHSSESFPYDKRSITEQRERASLNPKDLLDFELSSMATKRGRAQSMNTHGAVKNPSSVLSKYGYSAKSQFFSSNVVCLSDNDHKEPLRDTFVTSNCVSEVPNRSSKVGPPSTNIGSAMEEYEHLFRTPTNSGQASPMATESKIFNEMSYFDYKIPDNLLSAFHSRDFPPPEDEMDNDDQMSVDFDESLGILTPSQMKDCTLCPDLPTSCSDIRAMDFPSSESFDDINDLPEDEQVHNVSVHFLPESSSASRSLEVTKQNSAGNFLKKDKIPEEAKSESMVSSTDEFLFSISQKGFQEYNIGAQFSKSDAVRDSHRSISTQEFARSVKLINLPSDHDSKLNFAEKELPAKFNGLNSLNKMRIEESINSSKNFNARASEITFSQFPAMLSTDQNKDDHQITDNHNLSDTSKMKMIAMGTYGDDDMSRKNYDTDSSRDSLLQAESENSAIKEKLTVSWDDCVAQNNDCMFTPVERPESVYTVASNDTGFQEDGEIEGETGMTTSIDSTEGNKRFSTTSRDSCIVTEDMDGYKIAESNSTSGYSTGLSDSCCNDRPDDDISGKPFTDEEIQDSVGPCDSEDAFSFHDNSLSKDITMPNPETSDVTTETVTALYQDSTSEAFCETMVEDATLTEIHDLLLSPEENKSETLEEDKEVNNVVMEEPKCESSGPNSSKTSDKTASSVSAPSSSKSTPERKPNISSRGKVDSQRNQRAAVTSNKPLKSSRLCDSEADRKKQLAKSPKKNVMSKIKAMIEATSCKTMNKTKPEPSESGHKRVASAPKKSRWEAVTSKIAASLAEEKSKPKAKRDIKSRVDTNLALARQQLTSCKSPNLSSRGDGSMSPISVSSRRPLSERNSGAGSVKEGRVSTSREKHGPKSPRPGKPCITSRSASPVAASESSTTSVSVTSHNSRSKIAHWKGSNSTVASSAPPQSASLKRQVASTPAMKPPLQTARTTGSRVVPKKPLTVTKPRITLTVPTDTRVRSQSPSRSVSSIKQERLLHQPRSCKEQAGSRGVHHSTKPVRPPMWLSKAELTQEIQRLGNLCEARTKELNRLKMETKHVSAGFDSFATLFKYMVDDLNALSVPKLTKDLEKTLKQLELTKQDLAYYEREVEEIKAHHCQELNDLSNKLYDVYQSEVAELNNKHQEEINRLKSEHEKQMESLTESYSASDEEIRLKHEKLIANLEQEITKQREELQLYQEKEIKDLEEKHAQGTKVLQEHIDQLQKKYAELKQHSMSMEDALRKDTDSKLQWVTTRKSDLEKEVESLKTVLELKNKELHSLRVQNLEMEKQLEELPFAKEKIKMLQARAEDLEALMVEKTKLERKLSNENHQVKEIYEKEAKVNRRLSMENEELQWRLRQAEQSLISGSFSEVVESPEEADGAASPAKSPAPQILSRSVFFTFVDKDNTSPHSPRSQYKKITPGFSANYKTSPGKASKSPPAPSPRKMRSQSDVLHSMNSGNGSTPRKLAKQPTNKNKAPPKRQRSGSDCGKQPAENNDVSFLSVTESMTSSVSSESSVFEHRERLLEEHKDQIMASLEILREQRSAESSVDESVTQKKWCRDDSFVPNETHKFESEEMSRSAEFADPKTFYHMTFPVLKEAGIADCDIDDSARSSNSANSPMKEGTSDIMHSTSNTSLPNEREENLQVSQISSNVTNVSPEETCDPVVTSNNTKSKVSLQSALSAEDLHKTESNECNIAQDRFRTV